MKRSFVTEALMRQTMSVEELEAAGVDPVGEIDENALIENQEAEVPVEREYMFFYKLTDMSQLFAATKIIEQEQFEIELPVVPGSNLKGFLRVRSERVKGGDEVNTQYTTTLKVSEEGIVGRKELTTEVTEEYYEVYKSLAAKGMTKTRFIFPIEGSEGKGPEGAAMVWEIDVFDDPTTEGACPWVKVDLEVSGELAEIPAFPLSYAKRITNQWNQRTEAEQEFIKQLFSKVYTKEAEDNLDVPTDEETAETEVAA